MRKLMCLFFVSVSLPALAEFTGPEKVELLKVRAAIKSVRATVTEHCHLGTAQTVSCDWALSGLFNLQQSVGWFFHINANPNASAGAALLTIGMSEQWGDMRARVVAEAFKELNRAIFELESRAPDLPLAGAVATLRSVNATLSYAEPFPPPYPRFFGPHANYDVDQMVLWVVQRYLSQTLQEMVAAYAAGFTSANLDTYFAQVEQAANLAMEVQFIKAFVVPVEGAFAAYTNEFTAALPEGTTRKAFVAYALAGQRSSTSPGVGDRLHRATAGFGNLQVRGLADATVQFAAIEDPAVRLTVSGHIKNAQIHFSDAWRHLDMWFDGFSQIHFPIAPRPPDPPPPGPPPAPMIPDGFFDTEVSALQAIINALRAKEDKP